MIYIQWNNLLTSGVLSFQTSITLKATSAPTINNTLLFSLDAQIDPCCKVLVCSNTLKSFNLLQIKLNSISEGENAC